MNRRFVLHSETFHDNLLIGFGEYYFILKGNLEAMDAFFQPDQLGYVSGLLSWQGDCCGGRWQCNQPKHACGGWDQCRSTQNDSCNASNQ
jgi:hypothetical protein